MSHQNEGPALSSGTYIIQNVSFGGFMAQKEARGTSGSRIVILDQCPFKWEVKRLNDNNYTLRVDRNITEFAVHLDASVFTKDQPEQYKLVPVQRDRRVYYEIRTTSGDGRRFKTTGMNQKVLAEKETSSRDEFAWLFTEEIPKSDPYGVWSGNSGYFAYGGITEDHPLLDRFCLIDQTDDRWQNLWKKISELNNEAMGMKIYKVIFFQRHGHATNNRPEADTKKKASDLPLRDAPLTQEGLIQSFNVQTMWTTENSLREGTAGIGIPQISYCSPLTRCLETHTVSFASLLGAAGGPAIITKVYEDCREIVTSSEAEHRRSADCIQEMFPKFDIKLESDEDPLWPREVSPVHDRAKEVLDRIFNEESSKKRFVWITAHSGIIRVIMNVLRFDHSQIPILNGSVIPIICHNNVDNLLNPGLYKIDYVPEPSLFADGVKPGDPVIASDRDPSTWLVKLVNADEKLYTIQLIETRTQTQKPPYYWYPRKTTVDSRTEVVYVILWTEKCEWRLIPVGDSEPWVYYIELPVKSRSEDTQLVEVKRRDYGTGSHGHAPDDGQPLIVGGVKSVGPDSPRWRFIGIPPFS